MGLFALVQTHCKVLTVSMFTDTNQSSYSREGWSSFLLAHLLLVLDLLPHWSTGVLGMNRWKRVQNYTATYFANLCTGLD